MRLTYTYRIEEKLKHTTTHISDIDIEVDYNPETGKVEEIIDVFAFNSNGRGVVDIGDFLINVLDLDGKIDEIADWHALYHIELQNKKELKEIA